MKSKLVAYLLWCLCFFGFCGIHRFYIGKYGTGILWLLTFGMVFIGQFIDLFILAGQVDTANDRAELRWLRRYVGPGQVAARDGRPMNRRRADMKACPHCAEPIRAAAKVCRHCGANLTQEMDTADEVTISSCPECQHILEVPTHLLNVRGRCEHCGAIIRPEAPRAKQA